MKINWDNSQCYAALVTRVLWVDWKIKSTITTQLWTLCQGCDAQNLDTFWSECKTNTLRLQSFIMKHPSLFEPFLILPKLQWMSPG